MPIISQHRLLLFALLTTVLVSLGCDESSSEAESRIRVLLTDAPAELVEANVVIEEIALIGDGERVVLLADDPQPFNLLSLQDGITATLADVLIPDGSYNQLRVIVNEAASVVLDDGSTENLKIPSGSQSGIKILLPSFELTDDIVEVIVDFDVSKSFVKRGNSDKGYIFKPVLKPLSLLINNETVELPDDGDGDS